MSIQSEITRISGNVSDALDAVAAKGVAVSEDANSDDLATLISGIQTTFTLPAGGTSGQAIIKQSEVDGDAGWGSMITTFEITLAAANWSDNSQLISNANFIANGYKYDIAPAPAAFEPFVTAGIYAYDILIDGQITFACQETPSADITVYVARLAVSTFPELPPEEPETSLPDFDKIYPVGSIYISANSTNPAALFGGTWVQIKDRFLLASGDSYAAGSTGGEAEHTLTVDEMPSHTHDILSGYGDATKTFDSYRYETWGANQYGAKSGILGAQATGGSQPHNNMPPYLAVYVWQRTA